MTIPMQYALRRRMMMGANGQRKIQFEVSGLELVDPAFKSQVFYALAGMTWAEWCNSIYNPTPVEGGWAAIYVGEFWTGKSNVVCIGNENNAITYIAGTHLFGSEVIIEGYKYEVLID